MTRLAVLVRAVNVGGHNRLPMAAFRDLLTGLGCAEVVSYLQSGQAVCDAEPEGLAGRVEAALTEHLGLSVAVFVRTGAELAAVVAGNPFPARAATPKQLHVAFTDGEPSPDRLAEVGLQHGQDALAVVPGVPGAVYLSYAQGSGESPLGAALRRLAPVATARNWTTVLRLAELAGGPAGP